MRLKSFIVGRSGTVMGNKGTKMEIMVNGSKFEIVQEHLSYEDIALLAGKPEAKDLTVVYTRPPKDNRGVSGTLIPGRSIDVEDKMTFDAVRTGAA